jgi:hypothetical protein
MTKRTLGVSILAVIFIAEVVLVGPQVIRSLRGVDDKHSPSERVAVQPRTESSESQTKSYVPIVSGDFRPHPMVLGVEFSPVTNFDVLSMNEAVGKVEDSELVLGVVVNGQTRAYPLNMITGPYREFVNDSLGGLPIAPTW